MGVGEVVLVSCTGNAHGICCFGGCRVLKTRSYATAWAVGSFCSLLRAILRPRNTVVGCWAPPQVCAASFHVQRLGVLYPKCTVSGHSRDGCQIEVIILVAVRGACATKAELVYRLLLPDVRRCCATGVP